MSSMYSNLTAKDCCQEISSNLTQVTTQKSLVLVNTLDTF